jgi:predicted benzoate:H+ symporter BenE
MAFIVSQFLFIVFGLVGLIVWAFSDVPLAVREIALNTRRDAGYGGSYVLIRVLSVCLKILAVLIWIFGVAAILGVSLQGELFERFLEGTARM